MITIGALIGMAAFTRIFTAIDIRVIGAVLCIVFAGVNLVGIKGAAMVQRVLVLGLLGLLAVYVIKGFPAVDDHRPGNRGG